MKNELQRVVAEIPNDELIEGLRLIGNELRQKCKSGGKDCEICTKQKHVLEAAASRIESAQAVAPGGGWSPYIAGYMQGANDHASEQLDQLELRVTAEGSAIHDGYGGLVESTTCAWKTVPTIPTREMCEAADRLTHCADWPQLYDAMLAAAPASEPPHWQANMTADDTTGKCCAFMGTERCSCGLEERAIETTLDVEQEQAGELPEVEAISRSQLIDTRIEAKFHKSIVPHLTKKQQGYVMGAFRDALLRRAARVEVTEKLASQVCAAYMCQMEGAISFTPTLPAIKAMERALTKALELGK